jgi:hypothetical protein
MTIGRSDVLIGGDWARIGAAASSRTNGRIETPEVSSRDDTPRRRGNQ